MTAPSAIHLSDLPLPPRTLALLTAHGIETAEDLAAIIDTGELETVRGVGPATARAIEDAAFAHGVVHSTALAARWLREADRKLLGYVVRQDQMAYISTATTDAAIMWAIRLAQFRAIAAHHPSVPLSAVLAVMDGEGDK